jgi:hypothetical protein
MLLRAFRGLALVTDCSKSKAVHQRAPALLVHPGCSLLRPVCLLPLIFAACLLRACADASISPDGTMAAAAVWRLQDPAADAAASAAADEGLQEKLLPLAVGLYRAEALKPALEQYSVNAGDEVKTAEREVVQQVLPVLLSACGAGLPPQQGGFGGAAGAGAGAGEVHAWEQLQVRVGAWLRCCVWAAVQCA